MKTSRINNCFSLLKMHIVVFGTFVIFSLPYCLEAQEVYPTTSGELLFAFSDVENNGNNIPTNMRFSLFFHYGQYWHLNIGNNIGFYSGGAIRNVGFITDTNGVKTKHRTYNLGIPLALKLGSFKDHFYVYAGAEYEMLFHYKQKRITNNKKEKYSGWFDDHVNTFVPSIIGGIQFPKGINLKFKYYLDNILNTSYQGKDFGVPADYSGLSTQLYYLSLSLNVRTDKYMKKKPNNANKTNVNVSL